MRIAVTGGSGLVGRAIVRRLAKRHDVVNVDVARPTGVEHSPGEPAPSVQYAHADILDLIALSRAIDGAQAVVHAAAIPGPTFGSEDDILNVNVEGTKNVALAANEAGARRFVFISSDSVLGFARPIPSRRQRPTVAASSWQRRYSRDRQGGRPRWSASARHGSGCLKSMRNCAV
jgi:nucleoside-diphosphate-sugar epimerase